MIVKKIIIAVRVDLIIELIRRAVQNELHCIIITIVIAAVIVGIGIVRLAVNSSALRLSILHVRLLLLAILLGEGILKIIALEWLRRLSCRLLVNLLLIVIQEWLSSLHRLHVELASLDIGIKTQILEWFFDSLQI